MTEKEVFQYPVTPPDCQVGDTLSQMCVGCAFGPTCGYLEVGKTLADTNQQLATKVEELKATFWDDKVPGFHTRRGLEEKVKTELAEELREGKFGLVYGDVRGLKYVNDTFEHDRGDQFLAIAGMRMHSIARLGHREVIANGRERRRYSAAGYDLAFRDQQADEFGILVRNVDPYELSEISNRVAAAFSIDAAQVDAVVGRTPIVASINWVHALELEDELLNTPVAALERLVKIGDSRHLQIKHQQYQQMFGLARRDAARKGITFDYPGDNRLVAEQFYAQCCPDFALRGPQIMAQELAEYTQDSRS